MQSHDFDEFDRILQAVAAIYGRDLTPGVVALYWQGLCQYALAAVREALNRHVHNPDTGQFMPKPADVRRMLEGSTHEAALVAWSKVDHAIGKVGPYQSVVFDDPLVHRVIDDMSNWIKLGEKTEDEWPFVRNEFVNRYRGYCSRRETPAYPPVLIGLIEAENQRNGFQYNAPVLIGNVEQAKQVMAGGTHKPLLTLTQLRLEELDALPLAGQKKAA